MKIAFIGTGYVGLTSGACFAEMGHDVVCMDVDEAKIENLKKGILPIYEPGLEEIVIRNFQSGKLSFTTNAKEAIEFATVVFSAVGTPPGQGGHPNLKYVKSVAESFGKYINEHKVFVNKSTVPITTGDLCKEIIFNELEKRSADIDFDIVSNPEFLREGNAIHDTLYPDRLVVGTETDRAKEIMQKVYQKHLKNEVPTVFTDVKTAEIIKYAANAALATKISFINELANFCDSTGGDIKQVAKGIGLDKRIGDQFLNAGVGYGGSCLPKDTNALVALGRSIGSEFKVVQAAISANDDQKKILFKKLQEELPDLAGKTIAIWGLAFKPGTDDMRDAPSLDIIKELQEAGAIIKAYDPVATKNAKQLIKDKNITNTENAAHAAQDTDALMITTEWPEFIEADLIQVKSLMKGNILLDGRNIYSPQAASDAGFIYRSIGQKKTEQRNSQAINQKEKLTNIEIPSV